MGGNRLRDAVYFLLDAMMPHKNIWLTVSLGIPLVFVTATAVLFLLVFFESLVYLGLVLLIAWSIHRENASSDHVGRDAHHI